MKRSGRTAAALLVALTLAGCGAGIDWRYYAPFRVMGKERAVSPVDPAEVSYAGVMSKLHYVSITVDAVHFRNLRGTRGKQVAMGIELDGAVPKRSIKTVSEPVAAEGPNARLYFERPFSVEPFLYQGLRLTLKFTLRDVTPSEAKNLRGRLQSLGFLGGASKLIPGAVEALSQHATQFEAFLGKAYKDKLFTYSFSLYPSDMEGVRQEQILTGGRHIYIGIPGKGAPKNIRKLTPADLAYKLRLVGRRLEWRHNNKEYTESPYVVLSIIRYKRYPSDDTVLQKAITKLDRFIEQQNWPMARAEVPTVKEALLKDKRITQLERNLTKTWLDVREAQIVAGATKEPEAQYEALLKQVKLMGFIGKEFQQILEPFEVKKLLFDIRRLKRMALEIASKTGESADQVRGVSKTALASIKPPPEPPQNPILSLKPPKVVTVTITKPEPFYKKWWFYALLGVAGAGLLTGTTAAVTAGSDAVSPLPVGKPGR